MRKAALAVIFVGITASAHAEIGYLQVHIANLQNQQISGVVIGPTGPGGVSRASDVADVLA